MTRTYGRAPRGQRVQGSVPGHWESVTLISGVWLSGVVAPVAFPGATDTPAFAGYVEQTLAPQLRPGDVMIWDKLKAARAAGARHAVEGGRGEPDAVAAVQPGPDADLGDVLEAQGMAAVGGGADDGGGLQGDGCGMRAVCPADIRGWFSSYDLCATQA